MADKSFGVKELNLLNASGTPTVTSPNNLNLNANTVAISTSATVGSNLTVSGQINVGNNIKIGNAGVCTATTFVGNLTGTASANAVLTGSTNNQLVTVTGANAITGESTLTYDGTSIFELQPSSATPARFIGDANRTGQGQHLAQFEGNWNGTLVGRMVVVAGEDTSNKDDGHLDFFTTSSGGSNARILRITSGGQVNIGDDFTQTTYKTQIETTNQNVLRLVTDSDDANGVELVLRKDSASPANHDNIGNIYFQGNDDSGASTFYASMEAYSSDVSNNSEDGYIRFRTRNDGTMGERLRIDSSGNLSISPNVYGGGGTSPQLYVRGTSGRQVKIHNPNAGTCSLQMTNATTGQGEDAGTQLFTQGGTGDFWIQSAYATADIAFATRPSGGSTTEKLRIRGSDGRVLVKNDVEFDTDGSGGLFGKIVRANASYSGNSNLDIAITQGNYIFTVRSGGVYHYNAIYMVTYYDNVDKGSAEMVQGDYQTTATHTVIHNGNNNGTFRLVFNRSFDGLNVRQLKLS